MPHWRSSLGIPQLGAAFHKVPDKSTVKLTAAILDKQPREFLSKNVN